MTIDATELLKHTTRALSKEVVETAGSREKMSTKTVKEGKAKTK